MDNLTALQIAITNTFSKAVLLHDTIIIKFEALIKAKNENEEELPTLSKVGDQLKELSAIYKDARDLLIAAEYLAGHDIFTIMNDFKITRSTVIKILKNKNIDIAK